MMDVKLDVGYRGILDDLKQILEFKTVTSVYTGGVKNIITGARSQYISSLSALERQISYCHSKNVQMNLALNSPCHIPDKNDTPAWKKLISYIKDVESAGVDGVIISHPFLMEMVKEQTDMNLIVSTICDVKNGRSALYYENMGGDVVVPSMNVNWDFKALTDIQSACRKMKLRIMVNQYCLPDCPWQKFHYNHLAHGGMDEDYFTHCVPVYLKNPALFLMNSAIRPEDIPLFTDFTKDFKISSRICPVEYTVKMIQAYSDQKYGGNFLDLFGSEFSNKLYIDNTKLGDVALLKIKCDKKCYQCSQCTTLYNQICTKK
jgi:collagenase-like PrtC family protease